MSWVAKRSPADGPALAGGLAFDSYLAALDREEIAAQVHADRSERLRALED